MYTFSTGTLAGPDALPQHIAGQMFRLRYEVFHQRLNWEVKVEAGLERDDYDDLKTVYVVGVKDSDQTVVAGWRLRPTSAPYMLKDTFPVLLQGKRAPESDTVWEVSRFAVRRGVAGEADTGAGSFSALTRQLMANTVCYAADHDITHGIWVTTPAVERMARKLGYSLHRWSEPVNLGAAYGVVQEIVVDDQSIDLAYSELGLVERAVKVAA